MQRIAVPLLKKRIAPYFGHCDEVLLLELASGKTRRRFYPLCAEDPWAIGLFLARMDVQKLICGGIWSLHKDWFSTHGIEVIDNQRGEMESIVQKLSR